MLTACPVFLMLWVVGVTSGRSVSYRVLRLEKLRCLNDEQFAVMRKYVCVWCKNFGFSIYSHLWMCELGLWQKGELCSSFVCNVFLRDSACVGLDFEREAELSVR